MKRAPRSVSRPYTLEDFIIAYRHTKAELFGERSIPSRLDLLKFEENLIGNLEKLRERVHASITGSGSEWWDNSEFLGGIRNHPKKVAPGTSPASRTPGGAPHLYITDAKLRWEHLRDTTAPSAEFRPMAIPSIEFQVVSMLWMMKVGHLLDAKLLPSCRGSRLKRVDDYSTNNGQDKTAGQINDDSPGIFRPYHFAYRGWRQDGLRSIEAQLLDDQRVVGITMDLRNYFHWIDPAALGNKAFWTESFEIKLGRRERSLNQLLTEMLIGWAAKTPDKTGLPVGLLASRVIANALLHQFDRATIENLNPVFYARYVDDVLLVIRPQGKMDSAMAIMSWISKNLGSEIATLQDDLTLSLQLNHVGDSRIEFGAQKQRIFDFRGKAGLDLLATINREIQELSSEFRLMPDFAEEEENVLKQALVAEHDFEIGADSLRKADSLTIRRLGLAILLRNYEMLERCMASPDDWKKIRQPFYDLLEAHVLTPERYPTYFQYLPRIFGLITANGDWDIGERILNRIGWIHDELAKLPGTSSKKP